MKNFTYIFILMALLLSGSLRAQFGYSFTSGTLNYNGIGGTTVFNTDDNNDITGNIPIGFNFSIGCTSYSQFQICTEGWIGLGGGMISNSNNNLSGSSQRPIIAPLWDNIRVSGSGSARIRYELSGTAPNRVLSIEFRRMRWSESSGSGSDRMISFIVMLYETSNIIQFNYDQEDDPATGTSASIGIAGQNVGQYISVSNGSISSTTTEYNVTNRPNSNTLYTFTPNTFPLCTGTPGSGTASSSTSTVNCTSSAVTLSLASAATGCGITYQWQSSPNNTTWTNISGATSTTYSTNVTSTTYFRCRTTCSGSGSSANSNSVLVSFVGCTGTPTSGTASSNISTTTCASNNVNFNLSGSATGCGITYQWQSSTNNITWTNIAGETNLTFSANILTTSYYRCVVTCASNSLFSTSNVVTISSTANPPSNDLPCAAIALVLGASSSGNNTCSFDSFEPAPGSCWSGGSVNTVWYTVVAPASGSLRVKTIILSGGVILQRTQIAAYSGTCTSLNQIACDVNAPNCGNYTPRNSELYLTGLTPGATYYISVDGENSDVGAFAILAIDGSGSFPLVQSQDCALANPICNQTTTLGNPGYQAIGGVCDQNGSGNCTGGEANSVWYRIKINPLLIGTSTLQFDIVPNDYGNPNPITGAVNPGYFGTGWETDYDFVLWKVNGTGATTCALINSSGPTPAACNYSALGLTGCSNNGNAPAAYPGFNGAYEPAPTVVANDEYVLVIQNYSNSTSGFTIQFPFLTPVQLQNPSIVYWSGGAFNNTYTTVNNWGGCNTPACLVSAEVSPSSSNQPELLAGTYGVNNLTINSGSTFTLRNGATLQICGNLINNGSLICDPGSTIEFIGLGTQNVTGAFENSDAFYNLTVNKLSGSVVLNNNIDVRGNFLTFSNTSVMNSNGMQVRVGGNFTNQRGNSTFSNTGTTGHLIFNGTGAQSYTQGSQQLDLNFVTMNKPSGVLTLNSNMFIKTNTGNLTLTDGVIVTGGNRVEVGNSAPNCVTPGNLTSYVAGNLYRAINGLGSYDFPVGTTSLYERANINFTAATSINQLRSRFDPWPSGPNTLNMTDCGGNFILPSQNMGYWTITASNSPNSGTYDVTLYSTGATNTAGATGWTVQKANNISSPWGLNGNCALSSVSVIQRTGLSGFSVFGVGQSTTPLPIELMEFYGYRYQDINVLKWTTVSELNSDYFLLEKSRNGIDFELMEKINAQGNSNTPVEYAATDLNPFHGITYYRLNFVDIDGSSEFSKTIAVSDVETPDLTVYSIYPNPGSKELNVDYSVSSKTNVTLGLTDASGRTMMSTAAEFQGNGTYTLQTDDLAPGLYLLVITNNEGFKEVYNWVKK